jgi:hypothetical protein
LYRVGVGWKGAEFCDRFEEVFDELFDGSELWGGFGADKRGF